MDVFSWVLLILGVLALLILLISYALYRYALVRPRPRKKQKPPAKKWLPHMPRIHEGEAFLDALPSEQVQIFAQDGTPLHAVFYPSQCSDIRRMGKPTLACLQNFSIRWAMRCSSRITGRMETAAAGSSGLGGWITKTACFGCSICASAWESPAKFCCTASPWERRLCSWRQASGRRSSKG